MKELDPAIGDIDLIGDASIAPDSVKLKNVAVLVTEWDSIMAALTRLAVDVQRLSARKTELEQVSLPASMTEAGVSSFVSDSGRSVKIEQVVRGNIPAISTVEKAKGPERTALAARRDTALEVVRAKWPGLIKTELSLSLGKGEAEVALRIAGLIREQFGFAPSVDETINPATLNSHFKELMEQGHVEEIPVEPFALYIGPIAKIK